MTTFAGQERASATRLEFFDADGHVLEHPSALCEFAPAGFTERVWHIETDAEGNEWAVMDGARTPANFMALAGTAGMSAADRARAQRGELRYTEVRPAAWDAGARLADMDEDSIDQAVLYPTLLLGIAGHRDTEFAVAMCRAYNDWLSDHTRGGQGRLHGVAILPQQDIAAAAHEIRRVAKLPGIVGVLVRPNPSADWRPFSDAVYDPLWSAASETGLPIGLHPFLTADLPGTCVGLRINQLRNSGSPLPPDPGGTAAIDNIFFTQAISNPFDMMSSMTFLLAGGVCERYPDLRVVFLESGGGWLVPWLERLDHHYEIFSWDVPQLKQEPSAYFRRQCWISFDPDESTLAFTATSPLCGPDRIVWASDYPHPDAVFPGVTRELQEALAPLTDDQVRMIASQNAAALYGL